MKRPGHAAGFTLVEALVTGTLSVVVFAVVNATFMVFTSNGSESFAQSKLQAQAEFVFDELYRNIRSADHVEHPTYIDDLPPTAAIQLYRLEQPQNMEVYCVDTDSIFKKCIGDECDLTPLLFLGQPIRVAHDEDAFEILGDNVVNLRAFVVLYTDESGKTHKMSLNNLMLRCRG